MFHIIDDEKMLADMVAEILNDSGLQAMAFSSPLDYLKQIDSDSFIQPLAIFTDIKMPEMNGFQLIDEVRKRFPAQKFIVISGGTGDERPIGSPACHFISKPYEPQFLVDVARAIRQCSRIRPTTDPVTDIEDCAWQCPLDCRACGNRIAVDHLAGNRSRIA